jgi:glycosyltransferase involved in cell wall biosynthesis
MSKYSPDSLLVTVIMPAYNGARYLAAAISSVLAQTYRPIEVIVVDDGSTDSTAQAAHRFAADVRYAYQDHRGVSAALNRGVELAQGSCLAFLDADDLWIKHKLLWQMAALQAHPEAEMVFGYLQPFQSADPEHGDADEIIRAGDSMVGYSKGTMLIRREALERVGLFETKWRVGEFMDWYARAVEKGLTSIMVPEIVLLRRVHDDNMSRREQGAQKDYARILKAALDRRRQSAKRE